MRFTGTSQELNKLDDAAAEIYANDELKKMALQGKLPTVEAQTTFKEKAKESYKKLGENRFIKIKKAFYDDVEFEFDFNIGNEQMNPQLVAENTANLLGMIGSNPALTQDPIARLFLFKHAEAVGISPGEIELAMAEANDKAKQLALQTPQEGGQVPNAVPSPIQGSRLPANNQTQ
jgi:hypothetical protein